MILILPFHPRDLEIFISTLIFISANFEIVILIMNKIAYYDFKLILIQTTTKSAVILVRIV